MFFQDFLIKIAEIKCDHSLVLLVEASELTVNQNWADVIRVFFCSVRSQKIIIRNALQAEALCEIIPEAIRSFFCRELI